MEGRTDISILCEWAKVLGHRLYSFLEKPFWRPAVYRGIKAERHYGSLKLVRRDTAGVELLNSDGEVCESGTLENGLVRTFWKRYEIESYLVHPDAIIRFAKSVGGKVVAEKACGFKCEVQLRVSAEE